MNIPKTCNQASWYEVETACAKIGEHLEDWNLIGYVFAVLDYIKRADDPEDAMLEVKAHLLLHNGHGRDEAYSHLAATALAELRKPGRVRRA